MTNKKKKDSKSIGGTINIETPLSIRKGTEEEMAVKKVANKRYHIEIDTGRRYENGRKILKRELFQGTKIEAEDREKQLKKEIQEIISEELKEIKNPFHGKEETFEEFAERWAKQKKHQVGPNTWKTYKGILFNHIIPYFKGCQVSDFNADLVEEYYYTKAGIKLHQHKAILDGIAKYAVRKKFISKTQQIEITEVKPPRWTKKEINCMLEPEELAKMLVSIEESVLFVPTYLAIATGARASEIIALRWSDIDYNKKKIHFTKSFYIDEDGELKEKRTKNEDSRAVAITKRDVKILNQIKEEREATENDLVCLNSEGEPFRVWTLSRNFSNRMKAKKRGLNITLHSLRHSHITLLLYEGFSQRYIQERVGQRDERTIKSYTHVIEDKEDNRIEVAMTKIVPYQSQKK